MSAPADQEKANQGLRSRKNPRELATARRRGDLLLLTSIAVVSALAALVLRHAPGSVVQDLADTAAWLRGGPKPEIVTWPAWGYAWLIALCPTLSWVVFLQACVGAAALFALIRRLRNDLPEHATLITVLCVLAIPWQDVQVTPYPSALAGSLTVLGILCLARALQGNQLRWATLAGLLAGLGQNFRTEFVLLPLFLAVCWAALALLRVIKGSQLRVMATFVIVALALQVPWAIFYHSQTGRYSMTESNLGHVLYVSLGSSPHNPWGIEANDQAAQRAVQATGASFSSLSVAGDQLLRRIVRDKIAEHPGGLMGRTLQQLRNTLMAPFSWGEPALSEAGAHDLDVLRQEFKARLGVGVNTLKLRTYASGEASEQAHGDRAAWAALAYQILGVVCGSLVLVLGLVGMAWMFCRPSRRPRDPLLWLLGLVAVYKLAQDVFLFYQVNYLNNVYPVFIPFAVFAANAVYAPFSHRGCPAVPYSKGV